MLLLDIMEYKFDDKRHIHSLDGTPLHGVTTVLSVISKPALIQWAANMAVKYVEDNFDWANADVEHLSNVLKEAKSAHRKKKEKAGDWGTLVHEAIEKWIKDNTLPTNLDQKGIEVFDKFRVWSADNNVKFLESEKHVW